MKKYSILDGIMEMEAFGFPKEILNTDNSNNSVVNNKRNTATKKTHEIKSVLIDFSIKSLEENFKKIELYKDNMTKEQKVELKAVVGKLYRLLR